MVWTNNILLVNTVWYGLTKQAARPVAPPGYRRNYVLYVRDTRTVDYTYHNVWSVWRQKCMIYTEGYRRATKTTDKHKLI